MTGKKTPELSGRFTITMQTALFSLLHLGFAAKTNEVKI
jgi:hypothetical protein